jgi:hypothetical protein
MSKRSSQGPPRKAQAYGARESQDTTLVRATVHGQATTFTTSAGGVYNFNVSLDPSALGGTDWADFSSTYDEFRIIGVRAVIAPIQFGVAVNGGLIAIAFDNDSATNPGSFSAVQQYSTCKYASAVWSTKPYDFTWWRPTKGKDTPIIWDDVANPSTSLGSIICYGSGLSATTNYLSIAFEFYCEFRGRR